MFVPLVAHDLKGPLRRLERLALEAQRDAGREDPQLLSLVSQARRARCLVDDLLAWCRLVEGRRHPEAVPLEPFLAAIWEEIAKPPGFRLELDCRIAETVADPVALGIVLRNLLENAVRHHDRPDGRVTVRCWRWQRRLRIRIEDDGPGLAPEEAMRVAAVLEDPEGAPAYTRLGLRLVAEALCHLGGRARLRPARDGRGTRIELSLPASAPGSGCIEAAKPA